MAHLKRGFLGLILVVLWANFSGKNIPALPAPIYPPTAKELGGDPGGGGCAKAALESGPPTQATEEPAPPSETSTSDPVLQDAEERVREDPREALEWVAQLPEKQYQAVLADQSFRASIRHMAGALAGRNSPDPQGHNLELQHFISLWAEVDLSAAHAWAMEQPQSIMRNEMIARIASIDSESNPPEAACWILEEIPAGAAQEEAVMTVVHHWGLQNLQEAFGWVNQFPSSSLRISATRELEEIASK